MTPRDVACLAAAAAGVIGALAPSGGVGGALAILCAVVVAGYALGPPSVVGPSPEVWVLRLVLGVVLLTLLFVVRVSGLAMGFKPLVIVLLVLGGVLVIIRRLRPRGRDSGRSARRERAASSAVGPLPLAPIEESGHPPSPDDASGSTHHIVLLDDGRTLAAEGRILLGRRGAAAAEKLNMRQSNGTDVTVVKIADTAQTLSRRHLLLDFTKDVWTVTDEGSLNGTTVSTPGGSIEQCEPGVPVPLSVDHVVTFGTHWLVLRRSDEEPAPTRTDDALSG